MSTPSAAGAACSGPSLLAAGGVTRGAGMHPGAACRGVTAACAAPLLPSVRRMLPSCGPSFVEPVCCRSA
eukprot:2885376-Heterocapsa_arctica.AAC.1